MAWAWSWRPFERDLELVMDCKRRPHCREVRGVDEGSASSSVRVLVEEWEKRWERRDRGRIRVLERGFRGLRGEKAFI